MPSPPHLENDSMKITIINVDDSARKTMQVAGEYTKKKEHELLMGQTSQGEPTQTNNNWKTTAADDKPT